MQQSDNSAGQVIQVLKDYHSGISGLELFERHGVFSAGVLELNRRFGDLDVELLKALVGLSEENARLKVMYADLSIRYHDLERIGQTIA